jgi:hypothetical protein
MSDDPEKELLIPEKAKDYKKAPAEEKTKLRDALFDLAMIDDLIKDCTSILGKKLREIELKLETVQKQYPDDPDVRSLEDIYLDLRDDFVRKENLDVDTSLGQIYTEMEAEMRQSNIKVGKIAEVEPKYVQVRNAFHALGKNGFSPEYSVLTENPNAPTVILILQIHPQQVGKKWIDGSGSVDSQRYIERILSTGITQTVFIEGFSNGVVLKRKSIDRMSIDPQGRKFAPVRAAHNNPSLSLVGYEEPTLNWLSAERLKYRLSSANVFIASNVAGHLNQNNTQLSSLVIGAAHEKEMPASRNIPILPVSRTLAYYGMNVIVVDAASRFMK